ncbi:MAG: DUF349 domain-containing protein [Prolixibacteraceae bacterium]|nr:DUF349 domain-containing protein [Prolixibacteraceae bacterium]
MESNDKLHSEAQDELKKSEIISENTVNEEAEVTSQDEKVNETELLVSEEIVNEVSEEIAEEPASEVEAEVEKTEETAEEPVVKDESVEEVVEAEPEIEAEIVAETETEVNEEVETVATEVEIPESKEEESIITQGVAQEEIDELIDSEDFDEEKLAEVEIDYSTYSEVDLINELRTLVETKSFFDIVNQVESIKINFYKKHKQKQLELKKKFIDEGGFEEEYKAEPDPYEQDLKALLQQFKQKKAEHSKDIEAEKEDNLKKKYEIIEEIKTLVNRKESINKTFQEFRDLQQKWREVGLVPQSNMKDLWENYHHHVENFYDYIKINKELRDLDLKRNLEEKISICEKAEALILEPSVVKSFNSLQKFHDLWREIGPVPRDKKEELWERFKAATTQINKKHQDFFENRKKSQKKNLDAKTALCEKVEEILALELSSHKDWEEKSKELVELQKYWRTIGFAPKKENNSIYDRFRNACDAFFDKKREFYSKHKDDQNNNLQLKIDLCLQAEALKDSTDWKKTTDEYISIQKKWKEIGPVPRKQSDIVWKRFRAACDYFFKQKSEFFNSKDTVEVENLKLKNELIDVVVNFKTSGNDEKDFELLRDFQRRWTEIGHVPIQDKNDVQKRFRDAINIQFDNLRVEDKDRSLLRFKNKMTDWKTSSKGQNKMFAERDKYATKLKHLENDLITLKNNIGFFADSKNAEALIKDVERKIAMNEEQIVYLKEKIRVIDDVDYNE